MIGGVRHVFKGGFPVGRSGKIIVFITILAMAAFAYVYISAQLGATLVSIDEENAVLRPELFESVMEALNNGDFASNQFSAPDDVSAENYNFVTYTVQLQGVNPLPAEWAILTLAPVSGDVVLVQGDPQTVAPFGKATVSATLLTRAHTGTERSLWVEYYVLGRALNAAVKPA